MMERMGLMNKNVKRIIAAAAAMIMSVSTLAGCSGGQKSGENQKVLNILTWDGYIPENIISEFQSEKNIKMNFSNFESNEEMLAKLEATGGGDYDLVIGSDYILKQAISENLIEKLDKSKLSNFENLDPAYLNQYYDPESEYTIPYSAGTPLIIYDKEKIGMEITSYEDLWNPALKGKLVLLDDARNTIGIVLKSMGESMNTTDPQILAKAKEKLMKLKDNIHHLDATNPYESIISGETDIGYMFTSQILTAMNEREGLDVVYPKEGMGFGIDSWFIPKGAKNQDSAYEFLNYIMDAETAANISEQIFYQCANKAAGEYLSAEYKSNPALYIPAEKLGEPEFIETLDPETTALYDEIWTSFKN